MRVGGGRTSNERVVDVWRFFRRESAQPSDVQRRIYSMDENLFRRIYIASRVARGLMAETWINQADAERLGTQIGFPPGYPWFDSEVFRATDYLYDHGLNPMAMLKTERLGMTFMDFVNCFDDDEILETPLPILESCDLPPFDFCPPEDLQYFALGLNSHDMEMAMCLRFFEQKIRELIAKMLHMDDLIIWKNMLRISDDLFEKNIPLFMARIHVKI